MYHPLMISKTREEKADKVSRMDGFEGLVHP
jgi:hypothetical protein